ncbi:MAG: hypothetical protein H7A32_03745, partial [Deltaproteobacteria bacterium]|nr:hypothetical protein [Deltaproteobacteria bacterium]
MGDEFVMTQNKRKTPRPVPRKPITEDLERTIIDFDISDFEDSQEENDQLDIPPLGQKTSDVIQNKTEDRKGAKKSEPVISDILNQKKKVSKSLPEEDFDKTAIDIDVSQLEPLNELKEITGKVRIPIDETAIVNVTPSEDSGFFDDDFFNEEITGTHHVNMDAVAPDDASEPAPQQDETAYLEMSQDDSYEDPNLEVS